MSIVSLIPDNSRLLRPDVSCTFLAHIQISRVP